MEKIRQKVSLPEVVTHLAMRCLYKGVGAGAGLRGWGIGGWGRGYILPKVSLPKVVPNLAMRCLYTGGQGAGGSVGYGEIGVWGTSD